MFRIYVISIFVVFCGAFIGCSSDETDINKKNKNEAKFQITPLSEPEIVQYQQCHSDEDCIYINNGCCDCANSGSTADGQRGHGKETAINKSKKAEFEALFSCNKLKGCTEMARYPMCGNGKISCQNNLCNFQLQR